jgi:ribosomal protein S18 acetylase RimI-like enzyme
VEADAPSVSSAFNSNRADSKALSTLVKHYRQEQAVSIVLKPIGIGDIALVDQILDGLREYSMRVDGVPKMTDGARHLLTAAPEGYGTESKYVFAVMLDSEPIGVVDVIRDFPTPSTGFIGLLAVVELHQHRGFGRATLAAIEHFARRDLAASKLRLAVVDTNPVLGFWHKMGFHETGEVNAYSGERVTGTARLLEKTLRKVLTNEQ